MLPQTVGDPNAVVVGRHAQKEVVWASILDAVISGFPPDHHTFQKLPVRSCSTPPSPFSFVRTCLNLCSLILPDNPHYISPFDLSTFDLVQLFVKTLGSSGMRDTSPLALACP